MIRNKLFPILFLLIATFLFLSILSSKRATETITYFPIDSSNYFTNAQTYLSSKAKNSHYNLIWDVRSTLNEPAYLRQDVALLYKNGQLASISNTWEQNTQILSKRKQLKDILAARNDAISFHYAEVHPDKNQFTSVQELSYAKLYTVIAPSFHSFAKPMTEEDKAQQQKLDAFTTKQRDESLQKALNHFKLNREDFRILSITELPLKKNEFLRPFSKQKREEIIGKLWEGLYKNYILGVQKDDGSIVTPLGSSVPLLLLSNNRNELLVLFTLADSTPIMLKQLI